MVATPSVGRAVGHIEGPDKVSGRARYTSDVQLPGILSGKSLRSPHPHARIRSIDTSRAKALPGVRAVITASDVPDRLIGRRVIDVPVLAREKVRFIGEKVAAVAADTPEIADEALLLIDVEYEELPAVFDPIAAMEPGAPIIHDDPSSYRGVPEGRPDIPNVLAQVFARHGDVEAGFAEADQVFEHTFRVASVHQGYIEPHAVVVRIDDDGKINCWISNKTPFVARRQISDALQIPEERINVNNVPIGGDFGGKGSLMDTVLCYHLARHAGAPVKMVMTYAEELTAACPRHVAVMTLRTGVTNDGRMTARTGRMIFDTGAYGAFTPNPMVGGPAHAAGPYKLYNIDIEGLRVYTNHVPAGNMRAPGGPQSIFAEECHTDLVARGLGMDPLEFRIRNSLVDGDESALGHRWADIMSKETLEAAGKAVGWDRPKPPNVGRGVSMYERAPGNGDSTHIVSIDGDAKITLLSGVPDTGTGSLTVLQQVVAEVLQAPLESVTVRTADTDTAAFDSGAGGSRVTRTAGRATLAAAQELRTALLDLAARIFDCSTDKLSHEGGAFIAEGGQRLTLSELMARAQELEETPITRSGSYSSANDPAGVTSFAAQIAEVEVDPETGQVRVRRIVSAHDVGTVINPLTHQGQVEGGVVQGIGQALSEQLIFEDGAVTNANLGDYKLPTMADIPQLETVLLETKHGPAPYEGKAIGELTNVPIPAAIANAIDDAIGVRITELPITAEKVYQALRAEQKQ
jgi:CO/xanthine dehydrogenase Mo-binding subunit